jgi:hypothetical protein
MIFLKRSKNTILQRGSKIKKSTVEDFNFAGQHAGKMLRY